MGTKIQNQMRAADVYVAGASGYVGQALVAAAARRGLRTVAHIRADSTGGDLLAAHFDSIGVICDRSAWTDEAMRTSLALHRPRWVFALLGTTAKRAKLEGFGSAASAYEAVDYRLSKILLDAVASAQGCERFVYLSAAGVGARRPKNPYMLARWKMERDLAASWVPHCIVRPAIISGNDRAQARPGERVAARLGDAALGLLAKMGLHSAGHYRSIDANTLAEVLLEVASQPSIEPVVDVHRISELASALKTF